MHRQCLINNERKRKHQHFYVGRKVCHYISGQAIVATAAGVPIALWTALLIPNQWSSNIAIGNYSLLSNRSGSHNIAIGHGAGYYIDADDDIRIIRRLKRDINFRKRSFNSVINQYYSTVRPMHIKFVEPTKKYSDIIITNNEVNDLSIDIIYSNILSILKKGN